MYKRIIRPILFLFPAETAHKLIFAAFKVMRHIPGMGALMRLFFSPKSKSLEKEVLGIKFKNPVGIAAGLDKNGEFYNDLANFGFSFVEIGSLTPEPQDGNPKPRIFRLPEDQVIINRMGIPNKGARYAVDQLKSRHPNIVVAASLSKNSKTPNDQAYKDIERSFALLYDFVDFFVLNVSCPNVKDLTELQDITILSEILDHLTNYRLFNDDHKPILLKVSPDIPIEQLDEIIDLALVSGIEGIVATNTTRRRDNLKADAKTVEQIGNGGLSGAPIFERSLDFVKHIHQKSEGLLTIIAVGGIFTPEQAKQMLDAGASLIEVYSGFIYNGPSFAKKIIKHLKKTQNDNSVNMHNRR